MQESTGAPPVLAEAKQRALQLQLLWGDGRYTGPTVEAAATAAGLRVEVVKKPADQKSNCNLALSMGRRTHIRLVWQVSPPGKARF